MATNKLPVLNGCSDTEYENFVKFHYFQLSTSSVPEIFWKSLLVKLQNEIYDAGQYFQMCQVISEDEKESSCSQWQVIVINNRGISADDPNCVFLIDHAWTYKANEAQTSLLDHKCLIERMCNLMNIPFKESDIEEMVRRILKEMWKFNDTYTIGNSAPEENLPIWYVMDEFGSRIQHDGDPNCRIVPFYYHPHNSCYSILFPVRDIICGGEVTRNYVESPPVSDSVRDAQMLPWFPEDLTHIDVIQEEPPDIFQMEEKEAETLPCEDFLILPLPSERKIRVFSDYEYVQEYLTNKKFELTAHQDEADIIWSSSHFKDFKMLNKFPWKRVNQFPCEHLITTKNLLAVVSRRCQSGKLENQNANESCQPLWMLKTFCLKTELDKFVSQFQRNEKRMLDNTWIIKPWNYGRGIDHTVTDNLNHILRLPSTGPKVAQKYIHNPVLFHREDIAAKVKFDLRYIVLLLHVKPLKVAVYKNFWIRFCNKDFELQDFSDYEKHFTVNNYNNSFLLQIFCHDFISKFNAQNPSFQWEDVEKKIYQMIKEVFEAATMYSYPRGIPHNSQCKAAYGFDVMISWDADSKGSPIMQPKLLEINFNPDCKRACEYYSDFFNDLFKVMFLDDESCDTIKVL